MTYINLSSTFSIMKHYGICHKLSMHNVSGDKNSIGPIVFTSEI